ncbi:MFS transporter [Nocardia coubleae]|uniref:MFS transporter n=1 Tax=Nocardia coubleae TaxID=356147 RepID=A0A846VYY9_9NOCA|nr:MFS transporter [Nocardia coubleae]NKX86051.1 MFS transporter [Nocardia coubleae]
MPEVVGAEADEGAKPSPALVASLFTIATAQLMLVLDDSVVNVALPSIQRELHVSPVHLSWVVNAYILAFGALLMLGGRIGDLWGRRRTVQVGLIVFVVASLAGGLGQTAGMLIGARGLQGLGAALIAPNVLALITTTFAERKLRDTALSLYGAMSGLGIVIGLLVGGVLTGTLGWRWVFFVNVPIGLLVLLGTRTLIAPQPHRGQLGTIGAVLGTAGTFALVFAITRFGEDGFTDSVALIAVVVAIVVLAGFVRTQARSRNPLIPLSLFRDRNRTGAYLTMLLLAVGPMGSLYVLTLYLQRVRDYSPIMTGLAWLPFAVGIILGAGLAPKLLLAVAPRLVAGVGALLSALAALWFSTITTTSGYWTHLAPPMLVSALGFGLGVMALTQAAVYHVDSDKAGIASALLNSAQQIGVALGIAVLAGVAATITSHSSEAEPAALTDGYSGALLVAFAMLLTAAVVAVLFLRGNTQEPKPTGRSADALH